MGKKLTMCKQCEEKTVFAKLYVKELHKGRISFLSDTYNKNCDKYLFKCNKHGIEYEYRFDEVIRLLSGGCPKCHGGSIEKLPISTNEKYFLRFKIKARIKHGEKYQYVDHWFNKEERNKLYVKARCRKHHTIWEGSGNSHLKASTGGCKECANFFTKSFAKARSRNALRHEKVCTQCGVAKPISEFRKAGRSTALGIDRYKGECKSCASIKDKNYRDGMKESDKKRYRAAHRQYRSRKNQGISTSTKSCKSCGSIFISENRLYEYCSNECRRKCKSVYGGSYKSRAKRFGVFYDASVRKVKVFERDKWRCCECGCKVQKKDIYASDAAELDHIIPMSKGGPHSWSNVQTLCRRCNSSKSNNYEGQLVIGI